MTGARRSECPVDSHCWRRVRHATEAILHHELALLVLAASWEQPNQTGWWTYGVLWVMRLSAKLNLFSSVRNLSENFLPAHLRYMQTYSTRRACNWLMPLSVIAGAAVAVTLWHAASAQGADSFEATSMCLISGLLTLAVLENLFMVLPLPTAWMWKWGMGVKA